MDGHTQSETTEPEIARYRHAVDSVRAVLSAILPGRGDDDDDSEVAPPRRARSEGAEREMSAVAVRPSLCRTPRGSMGRPKRRVSFGRQPEEEPSHDSEAAEDFASGAQPPSVAVYIAPPAYSTYAGSAP